MARRFVLAPSYLPGNEVKSVLHNGVGRYVCQLQRLTFRFCKHSKDSLFVRAFVEEDLRDFARANPAVVCYVEPVKDESPVIHAEYLNGRSEDLGVGRYESKDELVKWIHHLRTRSGIEIERLEQPIRWSVPSVQGQWTPFTNQPSWTNVTQFPIRELSEYKNAIPSATQMLLDMVERQGEIGETEKSERIVDGGKLIVE